MGAQGPSSIIGAGAMPVPGGGARFRVRWAATEADIAATQALRHLCFVERAGRPSRPDGREADGYDALCRHAMVEETATGRLACSFRALVLPGGAALGQSYAAQFYDLRHLAGRGGAMIELGRFCVRPGAPDADVLRLAWGWLAGLVDATGAGLIFGCSSFAGTDPAPYADSLSLLAAGHLAPADAAPGRRAAETVPLVARAGVDRRAGLAAMPPLLRTYLGMGGWVSDHAVIDRDLGTLHVFTAVEIAAIPPARARALRAAAAMMAGAAAPPGPAEGLEAAATGG